ncbi:MAG: PilW family protein [Arenicellales bacterium]
MKTCCHTRYAGQTLTSLMIGMTIAIFIMAVAGKVYLQSKNTFTVRAALSSVNENGRFAIHELRRTLSMAGMGINAREAAHRETSAIVAAGRSGTVEGGGLKSDAIAVRYRQGTTCSHYIDLAKSSAPATVNLMVSDNQLMCRLDDGRSQPLVSGIKLMKILFGFDDNNDGYANRYLTAKEVHKIDTTARQTTAWQRIVSFHIGLLVFSSDYNLPLDRRPRTASSLQLPGFDYTVNAGDKYLYKVFSTTIYLRNMNTGLQVQ